MSVHNLPIVICGQRLDRLQPDHVFEYDEGVRIGLPEVSEEIVRQIVTAPREPLRETSIDDLTIFFDEVGKHWRDPENPWRQTLLRLAPAVTGYAESVVLNDVEYLGRTLDRAKQYDFLSTDLPDPYLLDEWRPFKAVYQRCWPRGLVAHVLAGNVPLVGLFAFYRSLVTKNLTVAKLPSRDVISALCFANCLVDVDPEHPASEALSVLYWEPGSRVEEKLLSNADVISAWGRGAAVEGARQHLRPGGEFIEFGPKRSFALLMEDAGEPDDLASRLAVDIVMYDQEACFSCQEVYAFEEAVELAEALGEMLERYEPIIARRPLDLDQEAHIQRARIEAMARGWTVFNSERTQWTVILTSGPAELPEHPLGRCVYVHPTSTLADVARLVDETVQTVAVAPSSQMMEAGEVLTAAGVDRVVPLGCMGHFRPGLTHDGFHPMQRMVRWSAIERDLSFKYRFATKQSVEAEVRRYAVTADAAP